MLVRPSLPLGRRHASFAQTVLACSETGASVTPWSLTAAARQLSSQAAELALRGMPRPLSATAATEITTATRSPRCSAPSAATERPCAARLWESRRRHEQRVRRRVPAPPSDGRERERNLVERARPRSHGPEGARGRREAQTRARGSGRTARSAYPRARAREDERVAHTRAPAASNSAAGAFPTAHVSSHGSQARLRTPDRSSAQAVCRARTMRHRDARCRPACRRSMLPWPGTPWAA